VKYPAQDLGTLLTAVGPVAGSDQWGQDVALLPSVAGTLIHTVDVITPVHDDPFVWGTIAAQHSFSDIYAAGGLPVSSLALLGVPRELPQEILRDVLASAAKACEVAGANLAGGHTWFDEEPRFGLTVVGKLIDKPISVTNGVAGDSLWLTKPIGTGILTTWHAATGEAIDEAVRLMLDSNETACRTAVSSGVRCGTDVSGNGLLGSIRAIAVASDLTAIVQTSSVPIIHGAIELASSGILSGGTLKNISWMRDACKFEHLPRSLYSCLCDSQTSGGLLLAAEKAPGTLIGKLVPFSGQRVVIE
jgi:selenide, water dikinase